MLEIRLAKDEDIESQKELWQICFGDEDSYIDFYFSSKYKNDETAVALCNEEIAAMATMIPTRMIMPNNQEFDLAMLYAIATHPKYQGMGFSTRIMDFCNDHLRENNKAMSILVPAEESLFDFYAKRGYKDGFYMRELNLSFEEISNYQISSHTQCTITLATSKEYNIIREEQLKGRLHIAYSDSDIEYQKKLSKQTGADIYTIYIGEIQGCAIIERINKEKVLIKELLLPDDLIKDGITQIAKILPAKEYILRLPAYLGKHLGGQVSQFGMIKVYGQVNIQISTEELGYLGIAYD